MINKLYNKRDNVWLLQSKLCSYEPCVKQTHAVLHDNNILIYLKILKNNIYFKTRTYSVFLLIIIIIIMVPSFPNAFGKEIRLFNWKCRTRR